jgi:hypothetical protein
MATISPGNPPPRVPPGGIAADDEPEEPVEQTA